MIVFKLKNIRSIEEAYIECPDVGLVTFTGENSHGKSVLIDALVRVIRGDVKHKEVRDTELIKDGAKEGMIFIQNDPSDLRLTILLRRGEGPDSQVMIIENDETRIERTLRLGGWDKILERFGFALVSNIPMQFREVYGKVLATNTTPKELGAIVNAVQADPSAEAIINNYKDVTYKELRSYKNVVEGKLNTLNNVLDSMKMVDEDSYVTMMETLKRTRDFCEGVNRLPSLLPLVPPPKEVSYVRLPDVKMLHRPDSIKLPVRLELEFNESLGKIRSVLDMICPECGRRYDLEEAHC